GEVVAEPRNDVESGLPLEDVALAAEPGYGIGTVHGQARMGAGLFEHDPFPRARVEAGVQAAPVGEVESLVYPVGHLLDRRTVARRQVRHQTTRQLHPGRHVEARATDVRYEAPVRGLDGQFLLSGRPDAEALGEAAIADIERTLAPAQ